MTTHVNYGTISAGYKPAAGVDTFINQSSGVVAGYGVILDHRVHVINYGIIEATGGNGVSIYAGGIVDNHDFVYGYSGIFADNAFATVTNDGAIDGIGQYGDGVFLSGGGSVSNAYKAHISGHFHGVAANSITSIYNGGEIYGRSAAAVLLQAGSVIDSGSIYAKNAGAGIEFEVPFGSVTIVQTGGFYPHTGSVVSKYDAGIAFDRAASSSANVSNAGSITGKTFGVHFGNSGSVSNSGAIKATAGTGVAFDAVAANPAASVVNSGLIEGTFDGVQIGNGGTVSNTGAIHGGAGYGLTIAGKGTITNSGAIIGDVAGVAIGVGMITNFGTIQGTGFAGFGARMGAGRLTNGSATSRGALIEGLIGVDVVAGALNATVTNFGTLVGNGGGVAVSFHDASDVLVVEVGCAFVGAVLGDGGTLDLDSGTGTLTGNVAGGAVTVSGSMAATAFTDFDMVQIGAAANFATSGAVTIGAGQSVIAAGALTLGASKVTVANAGTIETLGGTLTVKGKVTGAGQAMIEAGLLHFTSAFNQAVTFVGGVGTLELARSQTYTRTISGFSKTGGTSLDLDDIGFVGAGEATFSGDKKGGVLTVTDGTHTAHINLKGNYLSSTFIAASDGHGGVIIHDPPKAAALSPPHQFIAAMAGMGASGAAGAETMAAYRRHDPPMLAGPHAAIA
jgi:hypothetical protein